MTTRIDYTLSVHFKCKHRIMKVKKNYRIYPDPEDLASSFAAELSQRVIESGENGSPLTVAVSGGKTPGMLFEIIAEKFYSILGWENVKLFWVDERCVPPDDPESNYGMTKKKLLKNGMIPESNIFRMKGEDDPEKEAGRYSDVIMNNTRHKGGLPVFDIILLGMGEDGHTASIFPGNESLLTDERICAASVHPVTGQKRITLTGKVINNAEQIYFLVTGRGKSEIVNAIFRNSEESGRYPASHISSAAGTTTWLLDSEAGNLIN